jgi:hypothetical protein
MKPLPEEEQTVPMPTEEWVPPYIDALQSYSIQIEFLARGCIVSVGCKKIPFEKVSEAMAEITNYVNYPYETQQKWKKLLDLK